MVEHGPYTIFSADDETVLCAVTANLSYLEPAKPAEPSNDNRLGERFTARAR
jgi:hypothetical protein